MFVLCFSTKSKTRNQGRNASRGFFSAKETEGFYLLADSTPWAAQPFWTEYMEICFMGSTRKDSQQQVSLTRQRCAYPEFWRPLLPARWTHFLSTFILKCTMEPYTGAKFSEQLAFVYDTLHVWLLEMAIGEAFGSL